jgi:hypothetical protein
MVSANVPQRNSSVGQKALALALIYPEREKKEVGAKERLETLWKLKSFLKPASRKPARGTGKSGVGDRVP